MKIEILGEMPERSKLQEAVEALKMLKNKTGAGGNMTGWLNPVGAVRSGDFARIMAVSEEIRERADALIVIAIGGSYIGARAAIDMLNAARTHSGRSPKICYIGNGIDGTDLKTVLDYVDDKEYYVNVISKSGTTLGPSIGFRVIRAKLEAKYGEKAAEHIICTTDEEKGALRAVATQKGYRCFKIPSDIGGRYSVLTAVGLLPMAVAGIDVSAVISGAITASHIYTEESITNPALLYAAQRQTLSAKGKQVEILAYPGENMRFFSEWWKQLFGESEGKERKGIFPTTCQLTADLHSIGQFMQDGSPVFTETIVRFEHDPSPIVIPFSKENYDGLDALAGKNFSVIFNAAVEGVKKAHSEGGAPITELTFKTPDAATLGEMFMFFMISCAVSAYIQGVNPFDQPGVEAYKKNMYKLLDSMD